ncbi:hypothetical protein [Nonomuraea sp. NPDC049400]|uniref:hypothetical protein n=1 Tax=Nonomuraea sp. NPDC049400 TaxID=3364352 RepID=UPI0037BC403E
MGLQDDLVTSSYRDANRLVGIMYDCFKTVIIYDTGTVYDEATAWTHHAESPAA